MSMRRWEKSARAADSGPGGRPRAAFSFVEGRLGSWCLGSNRPDPKGGDGVTQLGRALDDLNIDIICAN